MILLLALLLLLSMSLLLELIVIFHLLFIIVIIMVFIIGIANWYFSCHWNCHFVFIVLLMLFLLLVALAYCCWHWHWHLQELYFWLVGEVTKDRPTIMFVILIHNFKTFLSCLLLLPAHQISVLKTGWKCNFVLSCENVLQTTKGNVVVTQWTENINVYCALDNTQKACCPDIWKIFSNYQVKWVTTIVKGNLLMIEKSSTQHICTV